jgi:hypothetical protein
VHSINDLLKCVQQLRMNDAFFKVMIPGCVPFLVNNTARFALGEELLTPIQSLPGSKALTRRPSCRFPAPVMVTKRLRSNCPPISLAISSRHHYDLVFAVTQTE